MAQYERTTVDRAVEVGGPPTGWLLVARVVTLGFAILQALLLLRIILLLLGADQVNGIVHFVLTTTNPFVDPFRGMFRFDRLAAAGSLLDVAAIVALIGWSLIEGLILAVLRILDRRIPD